MNFFWLFHRRQKDLIIPDYDPYDPKPYPGDLKPGYYKPYQVQMLLKENKKNPQVLQFLKEMLED